jgi:hypothetical protein
MPKVKSEWIEVPSVSDPFLNSQWLCSLIFDWVDIDKDGFIQLEEYASFSEYSIMSRLNSWIYKAPADKEKFAELLHS